MSTLEQTTPPVAFLLSEASGQRSRENFLLSLGKKLKAGEVAKVEDAVDLTTTSHTHSNTTLDVLASTTGLVVGDVYSITSASNIAAGTTFTYTGSSSGTLSIAALTTATGVSVHITKPAGVGPWLTAGDTAAGVSMYPADGTTAALMASFVARDAEVNLGRLIFPDSSDADVIAALAEIGIICRN